MSDKSKDVHRQQKKKLKSRVFPRSQGNKLHEAAGGVGNRDGEGSSQINEANRARAESSVGGRVRPGENIGRDFSTRENDSNPSLASGSKDCGNMFVMSKSRQQMWDRIEKRKAPVPAKGKTYRKAHYDPKEVDEVRANQILERRQRNDTKPGKILSHC